MTQLIDSSLWIDFLRPKTPPALKQTLAPVILSADSHLAEPIVFEVLRHATDREVKQIEKLFEAFPLLPTPTDLWGRAAELGRACRKKGITATSMDLLIATVAIHHDAVLVTFDADLARIASCSNLRVNLLKK
jgi:predicted nucleic acid-binding protein